MFKKILAIVLVLFVVAPVFVFASSNNSNSSSNDDLVEEVEDESDDDSVGDNQKQKGKNKEKGVFPLFFGKSKKQTMPAINTANVDVACVQKAIGVRRDAVESAMKTFDESRRTAFVARENALIEALNLTDAKEIKIAREAAWKTFKTALDNANKTFRTTRDGAYKTFRTSVQSCGVSKDLSSQLMGEKPSAAATSETPIAF